MFSGKRLKSDDVAASGDDYVEYRVKLSSHPVEDSTEHQNFLFRQAINLFHHGKCAVRFRIFNYKQYLNLFLIQIIDVKAKDGKGTFNVQHQGECQVKYQVRFELQCDGKEFILRIPRKVPDCVLACVQQR